MTTDAILVYINFKLLHDRMSVCPKGKNIRHDEKVFAGLLLIQ